MYKQLSIDGSESALINNAIALVREVLLQNKKTRDDDFDLIFDTWDLQGAVIPDDIKQKIKAVCYSPETITRARRFIQNDEKESKASAHVQVGRVNQEAVFRNHFRK